MSNLITKNNTKLEHTAVHHSHTASHPLLKFLGSYDNTPVSSDRNHYACAYCTEVLDMLLILEKYKNVWQQPYLHFGYSTPTIHLESSVCGNPYHFGLKHVQAEAHGAPPGLGVLGVAKTEEGVTLSWVGWREVPSTELICLGLHMICFLLWRAFVGWEAANTSRVGWPRRLVTQCNIMIAGQNDNQFLRGNSRAIAYVLVGTHNTSYIHPCHIDRCPA